MTGSLKPQLITITTMDKSESIKEIAAALADFHNKVGRVVKDATNPFFKSKYASLENVIETIEKPLGECGLSWVQFPNGDGLYTLITHKSGEWIGAIANLELKGHTPQDQGSAITYMRRYALSAALGLATEEDDDGNAATVAAKTIPFKADGKIVPPKAVADGRTALKKRIKELVDDEVLVPLENDGKAYHDYVLEATGYELVPENFASIVDALEAKKLENVG